MEFPNIDPIALQIGPIAIRWYALAYITGLLLGWRYCVYLTQFPPKAVTPVQLDDFLVWATLGIVLGGRLGYVAFYQPLYFLEYPLEIPQMWKGGMSFHGGLLGLIAGAFFFARRQKIEILRLFDLISAVGPIGLFFGRIANFVNGELWGRATDLP
ncbi:MAG: prolipoprotein diacylglyceryl transferase, partial [Alphaproteobacteria bacterium]|nr:prolipoprotein diacylglyceryl transferase [Alphaproteobacteria bacterium]